MLVRLVCGFISILFITACGGSKSIRIDNTTNQSRLPARTANYTKASTETPPTTTAGRSKAESVSTGIVDAAESLLGAKYRYAGDSPQRGFDCSGFTSFVYQSAGLHLPRMSSEQAHSGKRIEFDDAQPGDLVFFGTGRRVTHVGVVVGRGRGRLDVVHSTSSKGVIKQDVKASEYWRSRQLWAVSLESLL